MSRRQRFWNGFWDGMFVCTSLLWGLLFVGMVFVAPFVFWGLLLRSVI